MDRVIPSRYASRATQNVKEIKNVLDDSLFCTIAYSENSKVQALPTGFCMLDNHLFIHGSVKSNFLQQLLSAQEVCISTFIFDGLVLATSAFEHSVNYRSVNIISKAREVTQDADKTAVLKAFTEKYIPGRWSFLRPMTASEMHATKVLCFDIEEAVLKARKGPPSFKSDDWLDEIWTGVIPANLAYSAPIVNDSHKKIPPLPLHIQALLTPSK